jgi:hypothetical protein
MFHYVKRGIVKIEALLLTGKKRKKRRFDLMILG